MADEESPRKKIKLDEPKQNIHETLANLKEFQTETVLSNHSHRKQICLQGKFRGREGVGLVVLEKTAFDDKNFEAGGPFPTDCVLEKEFCNDIYGNYEFHPKTELNGIKTTVIYPATEKHIRKYKAQSVYLVVETPDIYKSVTLKYLEGEQFSIQWVHNILDHKSEVERIVYEDEDPETGFILLPDMKWDSNSLETLYLQAIVRKRGIRTIRDLTAEHLPLLKNIWEKGTKIIKEKYGLNSSQIRVFIHYQPSYYHLHVHFTRFQFDTVSTSAERAHMLNNVISNIELIPDYYQRATIAFSVRESSDLYKTFVENKILEVN